MLVSYSVSLLAMLNEWPEWPEWPNWPKWPDWPDWPEWPDWMDDRKLCRQLTVWYIFEVICNFLLMTLACANVAGARSISRETQLSTALWCRGAILWKMATMKFNVVALGPTSPGLSPTQKINNGRPAPAPGTGLRRPGKLFTKLSFI